MIDFAVATPGPGRFGFKLYASAHFLCVAQEMSEPAFKE